MRFPESCVEWTGSLNQGRLTEIELKFEPHADLKKANTTATAHVIARTWNVETIENDLGGPKYTNTMLLEVK